MTAVAAFALTRLSPFSLSLLDRSPSTLPPIPTLAELQKHAEIVTEAVPTYTPIAAPVRITHAQGQSRGQASSTGAGMGHGWFGGTPPPTYSKEDPFGKTGKERRLKKKKKTGWFRLGDDEVDAESNTPRMTGSRSYARESEVRHD